jgi:hypothetical protein
MPPTILAMVVGLVMLAPASMALAHQTAVLERAAEAPPGTVPVEVLEHAGEPRNAPTAYRQAASARPAVSGNTRWRMLVGPSGDAGGGMPWGPGGVAICFLLALIGLAAAPWRRRMVASLAVLALAVLAFESGLHSVHHLGDEAGASHCSVASASTQLAGTPEEGPALRLPVLAASENRPVQIAPVADPPFRCDVTRGPPTPLSA